LQLEIPKLRKRLSKLKSKIPPEFREDSSKVAIDKKRGEENKRLTPGGPGEAQPDTSTTAGKGEESSMLDASKTAPGAPAPAAPGKEPPAPGAALQGSDLVEDGAPGKRKGTPLKDRTDPVSKLLWHHCQNFKRVTGHDYYPKFEREGPHASQLLKAYDLETLKRINDLFFASKDQFILDAGHTFAIFRSQINKLISTSPEARTHRSQTSTGSLKKGARQLMAETLTEMVYDEWDGEKWVEVREPKKKPVTGGAQ
jgi:hypothetical protein